MNRTEIIVSRIRHEGELNLLRLIDSLENELKAGSNVNKVVRKKLQQSVKERRDLEIKIERLSQSWVKRLKFLFTGKI